jgi:deazaflavin-dependent oxidoreductase (nitroreductase family)
MREVMIGVRMLKFQVHALAYNEGCVSTMKRHIIHALQKYLFNPPVKFLFAIGIGRPGYALLETMGRKTGKPRRNPVGDGLVGSQFWIIAEHGENAGWVRNLMKHPQVRLKIRRGLRSYWHTGTAVILTEDDPLARQRWLARQRPGSSGNGRIVRLFGTSLLTVRIDLNDPQEQKP